MIAVFRRCPACGAVSLGLLPARCQFAACQAPLVRQAREPHLAPRDRNGEPACLPLPSAAAPSPAGPGLPS